MRFGMTFHVSEIEIFSALVFPHWYSEKFDQIVMQFNEPDERGAHMPSKLADPVIEQEKV